MRAIIFFLFLFFNVNVFAQSPLAARLFADGMAAANNGEYGAALTHYKSALRLAENEALHNEYLAKLYYNVGVCLFQTRRPELAAREFSTAVRLRKGGYHRALYALGMAELRLQNAAKARAAFQAALKLQPGDAEAWFDLAFAHLAEGNFPGAEKAFRRSVEFKSVDSALSRNNIGVILALKNEFASAEKEFEAALRESDGRLVEARRNLEFCKHRVSKQMIGQVEFRYAVRSADLRVG